MLASSRRLVAVGLRPRLLSTPTKTLFGVVAASAPRTGRALLVPCRSYVSAPKEGDGPLMERRADRDLPDIAKSRFRWSHTLPWFLLIVAGCSISIFNYQKSSSPVVASTLYALRVSPRARDYLGDEIFFQQRIPWISGEMNQLHGRINISFMVKGTKRAARMRFTSNRATSRGMFETVEWSLEGDDGHKIDLLEDGDADPFRGIQLLPDDYAEEFGLETPLSEQGSAVQALHKEEASKETRGFRQPTKR